MELFSKSPVSKPSAGLDYTEIKSHSSLLTNERLAILLYMLDLNSINLNTYYNENYLLKTKAVLYQVYKNIRPIIRNNTAVRIQFELETRVQGVYTLDAAFQMVEEMITYCMFHGFTYKRCFAISQQLNDLEIMMRDILQYFSYFFRPEYKQKPDVSIATEKYKQMADKLTVEKLKAVMGSNHKIDFNNLKNISDGSKQIEDMDNEANEDEDEVEDEEDEEKKDAV